MSSGALIISREGRIYVSADIMTTGQDPTDVTPWTEIDLAHNSDRGDEAAPIALNARRFDREAFKLGRKNAELSFQLDEAPGDTGYDILANAYINKTKIVVADMDGDITTTGSKGMVTNVYVSSFPITRPESDDIGAVAVKLLQSEDVDLYTDYTVA